MGDLGEQLTGSRLAHSLAPGGCLVQYLQTPLLLPFLYIKLRPQANPLNPPINSEACTRQVGAKDEVGGKKKLRAVMTSTALIGAPLPAESTHLSGNLHLNSQIASPSSRLSIIGLSSFSCKTVHAAVALAVVVTKSHLAANL